jgi:hypothetical protein
MVKEFWIKIVSPTLYYGLSIAVVYPIITTALGIYWRTTKDSMETGIYLTSFSGILNSILTGIIFGFWLCFISSLINIAIILMRKYNNK